MNKVTFSLEVFPPKNDVELSAIQSALYEFAALTPDFISVTYGAGGKGSMNTVDIASEIQNVHRISGIAHLTCRGTKRTDIDGILDNLKARNVSRILALRGDAGLENASDFVYATDLVEYIMKRGDFEVFAACYPEGHTESVGYNQDIDVMKMKSDLGVSRFISQLFYDNDDFFRMRDEMAKHGISTPVSAGIMPLTSVKQIMRIVTLSGAKLPARITKLVSRFENNPAAFRQAGLNFAVEQITELLSGDVQGIHVYCMNNPATAAYIKQNISTLLHGVN